VRYRTRNRTLYSGAGLFDLSNMSVSHARFACAGIGGFLLYPVNSKRESRYDEECVTENITPGIIAHLCTRGKYVGALFLIGQNGGFLGLYSCPLGFPPFFLYVVLAAQFLDTKQELVINSLRGVSPAISITRKPATICTTTLRPEEAETILV